MFGADAVRCMRRGAAGGAAYAYWRVHVTKTNSAAAVKVEIAELEFRDAPVGSVTSTGGTPIESGHYSTNDAADAFDGAYNTSWRSPGDYTLPHWLGYQHASAVECREVSIQAGYNSSRASYAPIDFTVEYSVDGTNWHVAATVTGESGWGASEIRTYQI